MRGRRKEREGEKKEYRGRQRSQNERPEPPLDRAFEMTYLPVKPWLRA